MNAYAELAAREAACSFAPSTPSGRLSSQARPDTPEGATSSPHPRAIEMAETIREIVFRDGSVTDAALVAEGYSAGEIVELGAEASERARLLMVSDGTAPDNYARIRAKAEYAGAMPLPGGFVPDRNAREAWGRYIKARRAHGFDPWIGQQTRCAELLRQFLQRMPLLPREINGIVTATIGAMKRVEEAAR